MLSYLTPRTLAKHLRTKCERSYTRFDGTNFDFARIRFDFIKYQLDLFATSSYTSLCGSDLFSLVRISQIVGRKESRSKLCGPNNSSKVFFFFIVLCLLLDKVLLCIIVIYYFDQLIIVHIVFITLTSYLLYISSI